MKSLLSLLLLCAVSGGLAAPFPLDMASLVGHQDVLYLSPARDGWEGLPLGNGTLGAQVWQPDGILFQLNSPLSGVYDGALGRLRVRSAISALTGLDSYRQRLSLYDATLRTEVKTTQGPVSWSACIPAQADALVVEYNDSRAGERDCFLELELWRPAATRSAADGLLLASDTLKLQGEPDYRYAFALGVEGSPATAVDSTGTTVRLLVPSGKFTLYLAFAASRDPEADVLAQAQARLQSLRVAGLKAVRAEHARWWADFWSRSHLLLSSEDGVADYLANLWYMHIYAMGAGSRGEVPPKFNGGLWLHDYDPREWGPAYWHWNTQETYWPLFAANHLDLCRPYLDMYWNMLPAVEKWTKETWETEGAQYQETIPFNAAMQVWEKERGVHPRLPLPKHVAHTNLILSSSAEIGMQFWWHYLYTGDLAFLRERAYPLMKAMGAFYLSYLEKDAAGRYNLDPSNAHETFWKVKNPATDLAALRFLFPVLIRASQLLGVDGDLRPVWQDRLDHLAPYAINDQTQAIRPFEPRPGEKIELANAENPELFPLGVFPLMTLGSPDYDLALRTFRARRNVNCYGWTTDSLCAARLGLAAAPVPNAAGTDLGLQELLPLHAEYYQDHPSGLQDYYGRKPAIHPYLEGSGTFATGMGEMLLQSWDGLLRVCPALPEAWNADFHLLAMGGFEVWGHAEQGKVTALWILSQRGEKLRLVNPFGGSATITNAGKPVLKSAAPVLECPTQAGQTYVIVPTGKSATPPRLTLKPNDAPKHLSPTSQRWLGKPLGAGQAWRPPQEPNAPAPPARVTTIDRAPRPPVTAVRFSAAPQLDGDLSEPGWQAAPSLGPFFLLGKATPASEQTDVRVGYDDQALYLGLTCWESRMTSLLVDYPATSRDQNVFQDDAVEIFVRPLGLPMWHFAVNALGARLDARGDSAAADDRRFNPEWQVAVERRGNRWIIEAALPWSSLAPALPRAGEEWGFNVGRSERPHGETSTWAPLSSVAFHLPAELGRLALADLPLSPAPAVTDPDLLGWWGFDDIVGSWVRDQSGQRHAGLMTVPLKPVPGPVGNALDFTGAGYVDIGDDPALDLTSSMTLSLWVNPRVAASMRLVDKGPVGGSGAYLLDTHPAANLRFISAAFTVWDQEHNLPLNQWSHLAVTLGSGRFRLYLNGEVLKEVTGLTGKMSVTDLSLRLGADSEGGSRFQGLLDEIRLYSQELSPEQIATLARRG